MMEQLDALEMWFRGRIQRISYTDKVTNKEVLHTANVDRKLLTDIEVNLFDVLAKEKRFDPNGIPPLCIRERNLVWVIKIAAYIGYDKKHDSVQSVKPYILCVPLIFIFIFQCCRACTQPGHKIHLY